MYCLTVAVRTIHLATFKFGCYNVLFNYSTNPFCFKSLLLSVFPLLCKLLLQNKNAPHTPYFELFVMLSSLLPCSFP